jgi:hypothetical protein
MLGNPTDARIRLLEDALLEYVALYGHTKRAIEAFVPPQTSDGQNPPEECLIHPHASPDTKTGAPLSHRASLQKISEPTVLHFKVK